MRAAPDRTLADPQQVIADLRGPLEERTAERDAVISYGTPSCLARAMTLSATASASVRPESMSLR